MRALSTGCALLLALSACGGEDPAKPKKLVAETLIELDLTQGLEERTNPLMSDGRPSHFEGLLRVQKLAGDALARGLFVRLGSFGGRHADVADWAQVLEAFRTAKKPVHCHFDELDNGGYALAAHCDKLSMTPAGMLNLVGLGAQVVQGRALLDQVGVKADLLQVGKYKGAAEPFTRDTISDEHRESLDTLLADLDGAFRVHLGKRAALSGSDLQRVLDGGPYNAGDALRAKLIDAVGYDDEARAHAKRAATARLIQRSLQPSDDRSLSVRDIVRALGGQRDRAYKDHAHLAVAFLTGQISDGDGSGFDGSASDPFVKTLRRWGDDTDVRAVLLRIESPGGSALASDRMWHAVRRVAQRKPVIVSLGDMAASGGYYIASAGSVIVASPSSIVGSIGVVGGKMVVEGLAGRLGVHITTLSRTQRSAWLSPFQPFSDAERSALEHMLQSTYRLFLERVATGRRREISALLPAAEGRVMGGERAAKLGLVDEVGGLARALQLAIERGKLPDSTAIESWPDAPDALTALSSVLGAHAGQASLSSELMQLLPRELTSAGGLVQGLMQAPERALAALPFALYVH